jgi:hypothetical protein
MSTVAVFLALGGGALAVSNLGKNSVGPKQLKKNAVLTSKVKNEAITGAKVKKGTLTGAQVNASTLGTVPSAQTAQTAQTANAVAPSEPLHEIGKPGQPQFENECKQADPETFPTTGFYKDREGLVHLQGDYSCSTGGVTAFTLPPGFRPARGMAFAMPLTPEGYVEVEPSDGIPAAGVYCSGTFCVLNGITFRVES